MFEYLGRFIAAVILVSAFGLSMRMAFAWFGYPVTLDNQPEYWFGVILGAGAVIISRRIGP